MSIYVWLKLTLMALLITSARCLKNVRLQLIPEIVEHGHEVTLPCYYELEDTPLYSLKWYRGNFEFYRFSPDENPPLKAFNFPWIEVDRNNSNKSQVTIRNVDYPLSGNFSCEITADAPTFLTERDTKKLTVVSLPKNKPVIVSERSRYKPGETLNANCSTSSSKPPVRLSFTLNNIEVDDTITQQNLQKHNYNDISDSRGDDIRQWIELSLYLQPYYYVNGQLNLRCTAKIPGIYEQTSEVQLGYGLREPVPERARLSRIRSLGNSLGRLGYPAWLSSFGITGAMWRQFLGFRKLYRAYVPRHK